MVILIIRAEDWLENGGLTMTGFVYGLIKGSPTAVDVTLAAFKLNWK